MHTLVVGLELASLKEWDGVSHQTQRCQLSKHIIVVQFFLTLLNALPQLMDSSLYLVFGHEDGPKCKLIILKIIKLFEVVHPLVLSSISALFQFTSLVNSLQDGIYFKDLILEPYFDISKGIGDLVLQVVKVFLQRLVLSILKQQLFLWQLRLIWQIVWTAQVRVYLGTVGQHRVQLILVEELV